MRFWLLIPSTMISRRRRIRGRLRILLRGFWRRLGVGCELFDYFVLFVVITLLLFILEF